MGVLSIWRTVLIMLSSIIGRFKCIRGRIKWLEKCFGRVAVRTLVEGSIRSRAEW